MNTEAASQLDRTADLLLEARRSRRPLTCLQPPLTEEQAYAVQRINVDRMLGDGTRRVGYKIGFTSESVRRQLGATQPDFGILFASAQVTGTIDISAFLQPRIEAEMALILSRDLPNDLTLDDAPDFVAYACAAAEIVDSAYEGWRFDVTGAIADNGCAAGFALSDQKLDLADFDRVGAAMTMERDGVQVSSGVGSATMGDPLAALCWLAAEAPVHGERPKAGDVILTGALGPMVELEAGSTYRIEIDQLGSLELSAVAER